MFLVLWQINKVIDTSVQLQRTRLAYDEIFANARQDGYRQATLYRERAQIQEKDKDRPDVQSQFLKSIL